MNINRRLYLDEIVKLLNPIARDLEPEIGSLGVSGAEVRSIDEANRTVTALVSTPNVDRYEEIVVPEAFAKWLPAFMRNPVFVAGHTYGGKSGEPTVIGHWVSMAVTKEGLIGTAKFADTRLAEEYWQLYVGKHMRAFSVGWLTHAYKMRDYKGDDGTKRKLRTFTEVELIEVSAVAIPANRESLVRAASAFAAAADDTRSRPHTSGGGASGGGRPSNRSIERVVQETLKRELDTGNLHGTMGAFIYEVARATIESLGLRPRDYDPYAGYEDGDESGACRHGHGAEVDDVEDLDLDLDEEIDELAEEDAQLMDDLKDALS